MKEIKEAIKNLKDCIYVYESKKEILEMNLFGGKKINVKKINKIIKKLEEMI